MKKSLLPVLGLLTAAGLILGTFSPLNAEEKPVEIVGVAKCKMCHKSAKRGNQFAVWEKSVHANAFATLASEQSLAIAKEMGIGDPQKAEECLYCHTTQAFLGGITAGTKYTEAEGVSCEACHGAGSLYKSKKIMVDRDLAVAAGMSPGDKAVCLKCHNEKSPTFKGFDYKERWAEIVHPGVATE
jgi:hypothetical protein